MTRSRQKMVQLLLRFRLQPLMSLLSHTLRRGLPGLLSRRFLKPEAWNTQRRPKKPTFLLKPMHLRFPPTIWATFSDLFSLHTLVLLHALSLRHYWRDSSLWALSVLSI
jgi:hypothetical protein